MNLKIVIYSADRSRPTWGEVPLAEKLRMIGSLIDACFNTSDFNELYIENKQKLSGVFCLPEYTFNNTGSSGQPIPLSHEEKKEILAFFKEIKIPGLLIFPGSIASVNALTPFKKDSFIEKYDHFKKKELLSYKEEVRKKFLSEVSFNMKFINESEFYARNSVYCFFFDKPYKKISKREALTDDYVNTAFISGINDPTFNYEGAAIGVSICRDAAEGYLDNYCNRVDFEIILSDFLSWDQIMPQITTPRIIIHASTRAQYSGVLDLNGNLVECFEEQIVHGFPVNQYTITVQDLLLDTEETQYKI